MATHASVLAWRIPWSEEPGMLQSMWSRGVSHVLDLVLITVTLGAAKVRTSQLDRCFSLGCVIHSPGGLWKLLMPETHSQSYLFNWSLGFLEAQ